MKSMNIKHLSALIILSTIILKLGAQTYVSGGIYSDITWTFLNSPYIVTDTVVVFPGVKLTIEPGVIVKFNDNVLLEIRQSCLIAQGTNTDSITFTSNSINPTHGNYLGILIPINGPQKSKFKYCNFLYANKALFPNDTVLIENSTFKHNTVGVYKPWFAEIDSCVFEMNHYGIENSHFSSILNCRFNNNIYGLYNIEDSSIDSCIIRLNTEIGIYDDGANIIKNNLIKENGIGILIRSGNSIINFNQIENNDVGIQYEWFENYSDISCNRICSNNIFNVNNTLPYAMIISENFWCTTDSVLISSTINDGYDNVSLGLISFMPVDTLQCYLSSGITPDLSHNTSFMFYPNPASSNLTIVFQADFLDNEMKIFNLLGEIKYSSKIKEQISNIDISNFVDGVYIIQIKSGSIINNQKFLKQ